MEAVQVAGHLDRCMEEPASAPNTGLAVLCEPISESHAGSEEAQIAGHSVGRAAGVGLATAKYHTCGRIGVSVQIVGRDANRPRGPSRLVIPDERIPAQAQVQRQPGIHAPVVLHEKSPICCLPDS